jgi:hypothetical protein
MPTYYVRTDGNDSNSGLSNISSGSWKTISKALGATGITNGDTLYIAPGTYREFATLTNNSVIETRVIGDPTSEIFNDVNPGIVRFTSLGSDNFSSTTFNSGTTLSGTGKSYYTFQKLYIEGLISLSQCYNIKFEDCKITRISTSPSSSVNCVSLAIADNNYTQFQRCIIQGGIVFTGTCSIGSGVTFNACAIRGVSATSSGSITVGTGGTSRIKFTNCTVSGAAGQQLFRGYDGAHTGVALEIYNCLLIPDFVGAATIGHNNTVWCIEDYNAGYIVRVGTNTGANSKNLYRRPFDEGQYYLFSTPAKFNLQPEVDSEIIGIGSSAYSSGTDILGNQWATPPTVGCVEYGTVSIVGLYQPVSKNETTYNIPANSISQSLNVYLGATGVSYNNSSLNVLYLRQNSNPVSIGLTFVSPTGTWKSGGFVEVDSSTLPGVYRFDLPNEMLVSGANSANLIVRGSNLFNGAFINIDLIESVTNSSIANTVWTNASRTITGGTADTVTTLTNKAGFAITNISEVQSGLSTVTINQIGASIGQSISDVGLTSTVTGRIDATVSSRLASASYTTPPTEASIASTVWTYTDRTLSSIGLSAYDIWNFTDRTLTSSSGATAYEIWNFNNRTLSSGSGISAYDVWNYTDRIITGGTGVSITQQFPDNFEFMLITNTGRIYLSKPDIKKITG